MVFVREPGLKPTISLLTQLTLVCNTRDMPSGHFGSAHKVSSLGERSHWFLVLSNTLPGPTGSRRLF